VRAYLSRTCPGHCHIYVYVAVCGGKVKENGRGERGVRMKGTRVLEERQRSEGSAENTQDRKMTDLIYLFTYLLIHSFIYYYYYLD